MIHTARRFTVFIPVSILWVWFMSLIVLGDSAVYASQTQGEVTPQTDSLQTLTAARKSLRKAQENGVDHLQVEAYVRLFHIHKRSKQPDSALWYLTQAEKVLKEKNAPTELATLYLTQEQFYKDRSDYSNAEVYAYKALSLYENTQSQKGIAEVYLQLSDLYYYQDQYTKGIAYAEKVIAMPVAQKYPKILARAYRYKANNQLFNDEAEIALPSAQKAIALLNEVQVNDENLMASRNTLANIQKHLQQYDAALENYERNLLFANTTGDRNGEIASNGNIGHVFLLKKEYEKALPYFLKAIDLMTTSGNTRNLWEIYMHTSISYEELGDYKNALKYDILYGRVRMEYLSSIITRLESELQVKYETEQKEATIARQESQITQQRNTQLLFIVLALLLGLGLLGVFLSLRNITKKRKALARANEELAIESSLEKVRNVALSLTTSEGMLEVARELYEQLLELGFHNIRNAIIDINNEADETFVDYDYSHDTGGIVTLMAYDDDPILEEQLGVIAKSTEHFSESIYEGQQLEKLIAMRREKGEPDDPRLFDCDVLSYNLYAFGNGAIGISNFGALSQSEKDILSRFRNVFTFAYQRYESLQKAEAQSREAQIEASLEKVRSVALGLNTSDDMLAVVQSLYEQLMDLGFKNIRNAIIDINNEENETFLDYDYSHEMGGTVTLMSYDDDPILEEQVRVIAMSTDRFSETILTGQQIQDLIDMRRANGEKDDLRLQHCDAISYNLYAFGNGAIGISNFGILGDDEKEILDRFRNVFTFAYQRYLDLKIKEKQEEELRKEKQRLEKALRKLQATQEQLVHSEKMASLGELTAGIAHEIQNPLNFVNNFSDLSQELLEELHEELEAGNMEEVKEISADLISNLSKINHHGTRANDIVKGMLQHSRVNNAQKEATDLNKLVDEYLRLAYHGLRAKDKSFNATMEQHLDEALQPIMIVPQDIGRVILNLFTNAFQACAQYKKDLPEREAKEYLPKVVVTTAQKQQHVVLSITDNGPGIPDEIKDKIFQPFFTTKPSGKGTGLGLSLSYDIVKAFGGSLKVASTQGEGTTFTIQLPIALDD